LRPKLAFESRADHPPMASHVDFAGLLHSQFTRSAYSSRCQLIVALNPSSRPT
jgi:hypothetical protein